MPNMTFSQEDKKVFNLALDLARNDFSAHIDGEKVSKADLEAHLRDKINNDILKGKTLYQAARRNETLIFEIIEEIVNTEIGENYLNSDIIDRFVEVKNRALGDTTAFYSEGGLLTVSTFAGNHWDTNRQLLDIGTEIKLPKEWAYIHVYEDLERFLLGIIGLDKLTDKVYKSLAKFFNDRIYTAFAGLASAVASEFSVTGNSDDDLGDLVDLVQAAGGYDNITIAGTKSALRKLAKVAPTALFAESQKEANAKSGTIEWWEGNSLLLIPQTLNANSLTVALPNDKLIVMGGDIKPIKLEYYGDTRTLSDFTGKKNADQTVDLQLQTKFGLGVVASEYFGVFEWQ